MGNSMKVRLKEGENHLEVTEALVQEFQNHVNVVDKSMAGFAKSVDSMRTTCEMLLRRFDDREHPSQGTVTGKECEEMDSSKLARNLLETIDSSVSDYKFVLLESLSKLFNFIVNIGNSYINPTYAFPVEFRVEEYKRNNTTADVEAGTSYYDARIESLQKEIKRLRDSYGYAKREMSLFKERETTYTTEIQMLEAKLRDMRTEDFAKGRVNWASSDAHTFDTYSETEELAVDKTDDDIEMVNVCYKHVDIKGANGSHEMVEELRNENLSLKEKVQKLQKALENETNEAEESRSKVEKLKNENDCLDQKIEKLEQDLENVTTEADESHAKVTKLRHEYDRLKAKVQDLEQENIIKAADVTNVMDEQLQNENESLKQEVQRLQRDMKTARDVSEEALKRNASEIDNLKQELQKVQKRNACRASVDKETSTSDIDELAQTNGSEDINLRDEINTLKEELELRKKKVFHALEYDLSSRYDSGAEEVKRDVYQALQRELTSCNIDLKIATWEPNKLVGVSTKKVIIVPVVCYFVDALKNKLNRALKDLEAPPDIVVMVIYNGSSQIVCEEIMKIESTDFQNIGGIFKFGFHKYLSDKRLQDTNEKNFNGLLQFLKGNKTCYLSR